MNIILQITSRQSERIGDDWLLCATACSGDLEGMQVAGEALRTSPASTFWGARLRERRAAFFMRANGKHIRQHLEAL